MITGTHLARAFGTRMALSDCSFEIDTGAVFGLVGPNGAGKTTTLRILAGLLQPTSGTASVDGVDVLTHPQVVRERVGWMPDFFGVYDRMTAREYLTFYASCYRIPRARVARLAEDLMDLVGLPDRMDMPVDALSRGMKQRLCLARALIPDPPVLLLDEPASGLDPRARVELRELVRELHSMGKTMVVSSHILPELAEMCTSFGFIDGGRMVAQGTLEELTGGRDRSTLRVNVSGDAQAAAVALDGVPQVVALRPGDGCVEVDVHAGAEATSAILQALLAAGVTVTAVNPVGSSLEDVFLRVTGQPLEQSA
ncbi:MAG TPA: ABC transporter ATP-binding protein [Candidatus Saccharimonadales bacterium]|nr:ABC transporter ATP-binding protein [Candidatus Saccharimonadales bacterium]